MNKYKSGMYAGSPAENTEEYVFDVYYNYRMKGKNTSDFIDMVMRESSLKLTRPSRYSGLYSGSYRY